VRERTNEQCLMELQGPDFAQEALIKITGNLDSFRGESLVLTRQVSSPRYRDNDQCRHVIDASLQPTRLATSD
jgi:hypothetical protein